MQKFFSSTLWAWAYFTNGPNAAASSARSPLIRTEDGDLLAPQPTTVLTVTDCGNTAKKILH